jgi:UDP-3-O-[3-hydroxymyristoyl] glucosamine N-acyltransferase
LKKNNMQFENAVDATWLANFSNAKIIGDTTLKATGINEINSVQKGDIVFVDHPKYYDKCLQSNATFIIINKEVDCPIGKVLLVVENPFEVYNNLTKHFRPIIFPNNTIGIHCSIDASAKIYPNVVIGDHVTIGKNCIIYPNVSIYANTIIGDNVIIQANTVIGSDAFYYNSKKNREVWYTKMHSCGSVVLQNDVEIGSGCTIDKGVSSQTIIGAGTKIDNLCHIAHDVVIGKNCLFAANVIIGGCTTIKDGVTIWGGAIINKTITIGENAVLLARTGVSNNLEGNKTYWGAPAQDAREAQKELIWVKRIPELWKKVMGK